MKRILILKASKDICGDEMSLISHHCRLLEMEVVEEEFDSEGNLIECLDRLEKESQNFDYLYLCTHGNTKEFLVDTGDSPSNIKWSRFSQLLCERDILNSESILLLACCKGGFFNVTADIFACCNRINFVCGVKWSVRPWDLTTGFVVFIHNIETKLAEPSYAAKKASLATDYTFVCYDRDEVESNPAYNHHRYSLFFELGWMDDEGNWIEDDPVINQNADIP